MSTCEQWLVAGWGINVFLDVVSKMQFLMTLAITSWTDVRQRARLASTYLTLLCLGLPFALVIVVAAAMLGIAAAAIAGLIWGLREVRVRPVFGLAVQGGAIGVLLLTIFASYRLYHLLPAGLAFGLVAVMVAGASILAVRQNAVWLAVLGPRPLSDGSS